MLHVFNDPFGEECRSLIEQYTTAKRPLPTPSVAVPLPTAFTQKAIIPSLNSYQDDTVQPEKPAIPKPASAPPPPRDDQPPLSAPTEVMADVPFIPNDSHDSYHRERRPMIDGEENWEDLVGVNHDRSSSRTRDDAGIHRRDISPSPEWNNRDRHNPDRFYEKRHERDRKHHRNKHEYRSRDRSRSPRERRDSRRRRSSSRHR